MASTSFPTFANGDVEIYFAWTGETYILHAHTLALHSPWFNAALSEKWDTPGNPRLENGKKRWKYELVFDEALGTGIFQRDSSRDPGEGFTTPTPTPTPTPTSSDAANAFEIGIQAHKELLGCFYLLKPEYIQEEYEYHHRNILALAQVAKYYGCEAVVRDHIENHFYFWREHLEFCEPYTLHSLLLLGRDSRSRWLSGMAINRIIASPNKQYVEALNTLSELGIKGLVEEKRHELIALYKECEHEMFCLGPLEDNKRGQIACSFFKVWLCKQVSLGYGSDFEEGYHALISKIHNARKDRERSELRTEICEYAKAVGLEANEKVLRDANIAMGKVLLHAAAITGVTVEDEGNRKRASIARDPSFTGFISIIPDELPWFSK